MSEFDYGFGGPMGDADSDRGDTILRQFHDAMVYRYGDQYQLTFEELRDKYKPGILEGLGLAANAVGMSDSQTRSAMENLAAAGNGKIPSTWNGYFGALSGKATTTNWMDAVIYTVTESAADIEQGLEETGEAIINTAKGVVDVASYGRYIIWAAAALFAWSVWKRKDEIGNKMVDSAGSALSAAPSGIVGLSKAAFKSVQSNPRRRRRK